MMQDCRLRATNLRGGKLFEAGERRPVGRLIGGLPLSIEYYFLFVASLSAMP
jgi:hypothetical protein